MIRVDPHADGVVVSVRAQPRALQSRIVGEHGGSLKVAVTDAPDKGKANHAIMQLLADQLGLKHAQVQLISGATSRNKRFLLVDQRANDVQARIERLTTKCEP